MTLVFKVVIFLKIFVNLDKKRLPGRIPVVAVAAAIRDIFKLLPANN
jgi:hypothetical protein